MREKLHNSARDPSNPQTAYTNRSSPVYTLTPTLKAHPHPTGTHKQGRITQPCPGTELCRQGLQSVLFVLPITSVNTVGSITHDSKDFVNWVGVRGVHSVVPRESGYSFRARFFETRVKTPG